MSLTLMGGGNSSSAAAPPPSSAFVLDIDTGLSAGTTMSLALTGAYDVTVDWGDATVETLTGSNTTISHNYGVDDQFTISIEGTAFAVGLFGSTTANSSKIVRCRSFGDLGLTAISGVFRGATNLVEVPATLPSTVTGLGLRRVFLGCTSFNQDISGWDVSSITSLDNLFRGCTSFNQDISGWDVSAVTSFFLMFGFGCAFNQNISGWDVSNVTEARMFASSSALSSANYDALLAGWSAQTLQSGLTLDAGSTQYSDAASRAILTGAPNNWTVTDGGQI